MARIVLHCSVIRLGNINSNKDGVFERTNDCPDNRRTGKPKVYSKTAFFFQKMHIRSCSNKLNSLFVIWLRGNVESQTDLKEIFF